MNDYISHGDFLLPLDMGIYWLKYLFVWSFQTGAPNLDGIIRLPGRLINLLFFQAFGNVPAAYFYLGSTLLICGVAFFCFTRYFLKIKSVSIALVGALLFMINPIFLGNVAKVGLIMAVAMLPLCLWMMQRTFEKRRLSYLVLAVVFLNISLIHPFTFAVNALIVLAYGLCMAVKNSDFVKTNRVGLAGIAGLTLLMNAYFLLPVAQLGTINKEAISQDITATPIDYTSLIDIANTGDIVTALSLSKNVLKDFEFFNQTYAPFYFTAVFLLYGVLFGLYVYHERDLKKQDKKRFVTLTAAFLILILLSTGTLFHIDAVIKWLINLPGGWIFRSPLKWQLYIPLFLCGALVLVLARTEKKWMRVGAQAALGVLFLVMNGYIAVDIYHKLLVPRHINQLASLASTDLSYKTLLFVGSSECSDFAQLQPDLFTELNQIANSRNVQLKRVSVDELGTVHMADYDYAMSCQTESQKQIAESKNFAQVQTFADGALALYKNQAPNAHVFAFDQLFALATLRNVNVKHDFVASQLQKGLHFVEEDASDQPASGVYDVFEGLSTANIKDGAVVVNLVPTGSEHQTLYVNNTQPLYYRVGDQKLEITTAPTNGYKMLSAGLQNRLSFTSQAHKTLELRYSDPTYQFSNLIPNPSFEEGLWQSTVGDCNRYDTNPKIGMSRTREQATDGQRALQLEAERHIACTSPADVPVKEGAQYLLSFDYQSTGTKPAGFHVGFNDDDAHEVTERLHDTGAAWQHFSKVIEVPKGATSLTLTVYAFADELSHSKNIALYDNFSLIEVPALQNNMYLVSQAPSVFVAPKKVDYQIVSPTEKRVKVSGVTTPFYLAVGETYHDQWKLALPGKPALAAASHIKLNNGVNGWFIDPTICSGGGCTKNQDGSYDMEFTVSFGPQTWFLAGLVVSAIAWIGGFAYVLYDWFNHRHQLRGLR